jgi:ribosomal protein S6--L-glutamate ligase
VRIHFILNRRAVPEPSPVLLEAYDHLRCRGFVVDDSIPEERLAAVADITPSHDLYLLKSHTELALSIAGALDSMGALLLNPYRSCLLTQDKITCNRVLAAAGLPVPATWVTESRDHVIDLLASGPLIVKPHRGHWGRGIAIMRTAGDVRETWSHGGTYIIQRYLASSQEELKVYVAGGQAFGVCKSFSETSFTDSGVPVQLDQTTREIAVACGEALGLTLYGADLVRTDAGPFIVDVNYFPGYKGVPDAGKIIAAHISEFASNHGRTTFAP